MPAVIDVHHHHVPQSLVERLRQEAPAGDRRLVSEAISITLSEVLSDLERHWADMDQAGIDQAVFHQCALNVFGSEVCRWMNDAGYAMSQRWPARFIPAAHFAPQDGAGAVQELERAVEQLGFRVVALPTSTLGVPLDHPAMEPIWARLDAWRVPVILHPALRPKGGRRHAIASTAASPASPTSRRRWCASFMPSCPVGPTSAWSYPTRGAPFRISRAPMAKTAQEQTHYQTTREMEKALGACTLIAVATAPGRRRCAFWGRWRGGTTSSSAPTIRWKPKTRPTCRNTGDWSATWGLSPTAVLGATLAGLLGQAGRP